MRFEPALQNRLMRALARLCAGILLVGGAMSPARAVEVMVFAAASLKEALDENVGAFAKMAGHRARVSYGGSNVLARQIENGAPADVFISADQEWMRYLEVRNLVAPGTRRDLAGNRLVLVAPSGSTIRLAIAPGFALSAALAGGRLALANPDAVPAGRYARAALERLGVWQGVEASLTRSENVRASLMLVARGETPLGIVYATDAIAEPRVRVVDVFGTELHPTIVYQGAAVAGRANATSRALLDYLGGAQARVVWTRRGFAPPP